MVTTVLDSKVNVTIFLKQYKPTKKQNVQNYCCQMMAQEVFKKKCTKIEDKEKLLVLKLSSIWKHGGKKNALIVVQDFIKLVNST
jgi:hypothetical protein